MDKIKTVCFVEPLVFGIIYFKIEIWRNPKQISISKVLHLIIMNLIGSSCLLVQLTELTYQVG
jgi:hypothetical protein